MKLHRIKAFLLIVVTLGFTTALFGQGTSCATADPFCTGTTYSFPNNTGTSAEAGPNYGCLITQPNPAWYYLEVATSGDIIIDISQTDGSGSGLDVDFICWGPFADPNTPCTAQLTAGNTVDCSYSPAPTETADILGAVAGEVYIMLITNFSNQTGNITFSQTGGTGATDCSIVTPTCPTVGFHGEDSGGNTYNLPVNVDCEQNGWFFLRANDAATAGGPIVPTVVVNVTTNGSATGNNIYGFENDGGWTSYWGAQNIPANSNYTFTMYEVDNVVPTDIGVEFCDQNSAADMSYTITDGNCGQTFATGTWTAGGSSAAGPGAPPPGTLCQFESFPASSVSGIATYTCPTCPPGSFITTNYGWAFFNPALAGPGSYDFTYCFDNECGCSGCATETIVVTNPHDATFSYAPSASCMVGTGSPTTNVVGGETETFSAPAGLSINGTTGVIDWSASTPGTYTITHTVAGVECSDVATFDVTVHPDPTANAGTPIALDCNTPSGNLSGSGGGTYSWVASGGGNITAGAGSATPTVDAAGTYTLTVTDGNGCTDTDAVTVTGDFATPTANAGTPTTIDCNTPTATLTATGGGTYSWVASGGGNITSGAGTATPTVDAGGTYTVTVTGTNGCTDTDAVTVTGDFATPTANAGASAVVDCNNPTVGLSASGGGTYSWVASGGGNITAGAGTATPTVDAAGTYTVTVTGTNGCTDTDFTTVTADFATPTANAGAAASIDCNSPTANLSASGGGTYSWAASGGGNITSGGTTATPTVDAAGTYTVTVTGSNGCTDTDAVVVTADFTTPTASAGAPTTIDCNTPTTSLSASGGGTYSWVASGGGNITSGATTATPTVDAGGTYTVTVTAANGCTDTDAVVVTADFTPPTAGAGSSFTLDCNTPTGSLSGTGGGTYSWVASGGGNITSGAATATPAIDSPGDYTVTVTAANGCTDTDVVTISGDFTLPPADAGSAMVIDCNNATVNLSGAGGVGYSWAASGGGNITAGATTATPTVDAAGTYTVTVTGANGCTDTDVTTVTTDFSTPTATIAPPAMITCSVTSITLDASGSTGTGGLTYSWAASGGGNIVSGGTTATPTVNSAGDYTVTVTHGNGCTDTFMVTVIADSSVPTAVATAPGDLNCTVVSMVLDGTGSSGSGGLSYSWVASGGGNIVSGGSTDSPTIDAAGTYTLTVTDSVSGCTSNDVVVINQDITLPTADILPPVTVDCNNPVITLDGSGSSQGANFTYDWTTAGGNILGSTTNDSVSVDASGDYTITVTNTTNTCVNSFMVSVTVDTVAPSADAGLDQTLTCAATDVTLDGSASSGTGLSYLWSGSGITAGGATATATANIPGTYLLTVTGSNGCTDTSSVLVIPDSNLPIADAGADMVIDCNNPSVSLDGTGSDSGASITYSWTTTTGNIVSGATTTTPTVDAAGSYTITVDNTSNGCSSVAVVNVTTDTIPPVADAGAAAVIDCNNTTATLDASASAGTGLTYVWSTTTGNIISGGTTANPVVDGAGTYDVLVTGSNGCTHSSTVTVTVDTIAPVANAAGAGDLNCNATTLTLDGSGSTGTISTYNWTTTGGNIVSGGTTDSPVVDAAGTYTLTVTGTNGCSTTSSVVVTSTPNPVADFSATPTSGDAPLLVDFLDNSTGAVSWAWTFGDGNSDTVQNPSNTYMTFGTYTATLTITDANGCTDTYSIDIEVNAESTLIIPNVFTPNGDGKNDLFVFSSSNLVDIEGAIYNRWGEVMYIWMSEAAGWDGRTTGGQLAPEGTYYYTFKAMNAQGEALDFSGSFQLDR